jgi:hypothetical protein
VESLGTGDLDRSGTVTLVENSAVVGILEEPVSVVAPLRAAVRESVGVQ